MRQDNVVGSDVVRRQLVHQVDFVIETGLSLEPGRYELLEDFRFVGNRRSELGRRVALLLRAVLTKP